MLLQRLAILGSFATLLASGGCNAVLGIEEAYDRNASSSVNHAQLLPTGTCAKPHGNCTSCFDDSNAFASCLASHDCRKALDEYRQCLGSACHQAGCLDALKAGAGRMVADWVKTEGCTDCVDGSPLADMCDLYCACMEQAMPKTAGTNAEGKTCESFNGSELPWLPAGNPAGDRAACKAACKEIDPASIHCRWSHCELANGGELANHCRHSISDSFCPRRSQATRLAPIAAWEAGVAMPIETAAAAAAPSASARTFSSFPAAEVVLSRRFERLGARIDRQEELDQVAALLVAHRLARAGAVESAAHV